MLPRCDHPDDAGFTVKVAYDTVRSLGIAERGRSSIFWPSSKLRGQLDVSDPLERVFDAYR